MGHRSATTMAPVVAAGILLLVGISAPVESAQLRLAAAEPITTTHTVRELAPQEGGALSSEDIEQLKNLHKREVVSTITAKLVPPFIRPPHCRFSPCTHPESGEEARDFVDRVETNLKVLDLSLGSLSRFKSFQAKRQHERARENFNLLKTLVQRDHDPSQTDEGNKQFEISELIQQWRKQQDEQHSSLSRFVAKKRERAEQLSAEQEHVVQLDSGMISGIERMLEETKTYAKDVRDVTSQLSKLRASVISGRLSAGTRDFCIKCEHNLLSDPLRSASKLSRAVGNFDTTVTVIKDTSYDASAMESLYKRVESSIKILDEKFAAYDSKFSELMENLVRQEQRMISAPISNLEMSESASVRSGTTAAARKPKRRRTTSRGGNSDTPDAFSKLDALVRAAEQSMVSAKSKLIKHKIKLQDPAVLGSLNDGVKAIDEIIQMERNALRTSDSQRWHDLQAAHQRAVVDPKVTDAIDALLMGTHSELDKVEQPLMRQIVTVNELVQSMMGEIEDARSHVHRSAAALKRVMNDCLSAATYLGAQFAALQNNAPGSNECTQCLGGEPMQLPAGLANLVKHAMPSLVQQLENSLSSALQSESELRGALRDELQDAEGMGSEM